MTPTSEPIEDVRRFVREELVRDEGLALRSDESLFGSGLLDSFAVTPLMLFLEDHFGIEIPAADVTLEDFDTLERIAALVRRLAAASG